MNVVRSVWASGQGDPVFMRSVNGWLTIFWVVMIPVSWALGWLNSVTYVSALALWSVVSGHWSTWQAARVEVAHERVQQELEEDPLEDSLRQRLVDGTILVVGSNFGIGSSREHVPLAMQGSGIRGLVGRSFARIFYRNCVNLGLAIVACPPAVAAAHDGSRLAIDQAGVVEVDGTRFDAPAAAPLLLELNAAGGLVEWTASRVGG